MIKRIKTLIYLIAVGIAVPLSLILIISACIYIYGMEFRSITRFDLFNAVGGGDPGVDAPTTGLFTQDLIKHRIKKWEDINYYSEDFQGTMLTVASRMDKLHLVRWLIDNGADVNPPKGLSPLFEVINHGSPKYGSYEIAELLLIHGANPYKIEDPLLAGEEGLTPLKIAEKQNAQWAIDLIQKYDKTVEQSRDENPN